MKALRCDICGRYFDVENSGVNNIALCRNDNIGQHLIKTLDICPECLRKFDEVSDFKILSKGRAQNENNL